VQSSRQSPDRIESRARLRREGLLLASLEHPNIVRAFELFELPSGEALLLELLELPSELREHLLLLGSVELPFVHLMEQVIRGHQRPSETSRGNQWQSPSDHHEFHLLGKPRVLLF
jgi:serine/threonine protein kinase